MISWLYSTILKIGSSQLRFSYLVLQVDGRIEIRNLGVDRFADHLAFTGMHESAHLCHNIVSYECAYRKIK